MNKRCSHCKEIKSQEDFSVAKRVKGGLQAWCKDCKRDYNAEYMKKYRKSEKYVETKKEQDKRYGQSDKAKAYRKEYWSRPHIKARRKVYMKEYVATRRKKEPKFRLDQSISGLINSSLKRYGGKKMRRSWEDLVDFKLEELVRHLEKQFNETMSWDNYGSYWWVDHIKPISLFRYKSAEELEFRECWSLLNLQPLEKIANIRKSNSYREE